MNRVCISFSSKNRLELTRQTIAPLMPQAGWDLWWYDASTDADAAEFFTDTVGPSAKQHLIGGSCRYIVCALTQMLDATDPVDDRPRFDYVGLCENDVLLDDDWYLPTMGLFELGKAEGLAVGAVSARTYEDRILVQRGAFGLMHNLGAGHIIFTRKAAEYILHRYRTGMTGENRRVFSMLSGIDIGRYWAFRGLDHMLVADWQWDRMLAQAGMATLALVPTKATQLEEIEKQGLKPAKLPVDDLKNDRAFKTFIERAHKIRHGDWEVPTTPGLRLFHDNVWTVFPHQIFGMGGSYSGDWRFKWSIGWGCFSWKSGAVPRRGKSNGGGDPRGDMGTVDSFPTAVIPCIGPVDVVVSGGEGGGRVKVEDELSGFSVDPEIGPEERVGVMQLAIPGAMGYRNVKLTALTPGMIFYGLRSREAQPYMNGTPFTFHALPPI
jgi:hypothetical protein